MTIATISTGSIVMQNPEMIWVLPTLVLIVLLCRILKFKSDQSGYQAIPPQKPLTVTHPLISLLPAVQSVSTGNKMQRAAVVWLILIMLVAALTNPVRIGAKLPEQFSQHSFQQDIVFIVDTSVSMLLRDYEADGQRIDRMSMLKAVLQEFTKELTGNRLSVIVFGDTAHTLVPFTQDTELVRRMLLRIETGMVGRFNAVGEAITYAVSETVKAPRRNPVLVLFTDMNESVGTKAPESAARLAAHYQLPLYTVAIGSAGQPTQQFQQQYQQQSQQLPQQAQSSSLIYGPVNLSALKTIAEATGARSYHASDVSSLKQAIKDITQLDRRDDTKPPRYYQQPLYMIPLLLILLLLSLLQWSHLLRRQKSQ